MVCYDVETFSDVARRKYGLRAGALGNYVYAEVEMSEAQVADAAKRNMHQQYD